MAILSVLVNPFGADASTVLQMLWIFAAGEDFVSKE